MQGTRKQKIIQVIFIAVSILMVISSLAPGLLYLRR